MAVMTRPIAIVGDGHFPDPFHQFRLQVQTRDVQAAPRAEITDVEAGVVRDSVFGQRPKCSDVRGEIPGPESAQLIGAALAEYGEAPGDESRLILFREVL